MRTAWLFVAALALAACNKKAGDSGSEATIPATPPVPGDLVITGELQEIPGAFPSNDLYNYAYVMKYKVVKVIQGDYSGEDILVGHYNPRFARAEIHDDQDSLVGGNVK